MEDRTEWYSMERHLREKERLAGIGELAAAIAHEIRNPLASMAGSLELLDHPESTTSEQREKLRHIVSREVSQLKRLLENFLIYARPAPPSRFEVDVAILVREVAETVNQAAEYKEHDLVVQATQVLPALIDPEQIRQLLWNLLKNAFEASPTNDEVELNARFETPDKKWIVLEVADRGPGVSPEIRKTMFDPFQTTKDSGTGLGLSIVHRIVENHGGRIDVESSQYGGALFRVILPAHSP
jgi:two-component system sensor histidine kinase PilS (NtrC family)